MAINPYHLRAFHAVARHGSFSRAADDSHVSQPTLSGQVRSLEQRFGVQLLVRHRRGVELTGVGRRLLELTTAVERMERDIDTLLSEEKLALAGNLTVGADAPYQIMPIIAGFQARYPAVSVSLRFGNSKWLLKALGDSLVDVIIAPNLATHHRLFRLPLAPDHLRLFVNLEHPWKSRRAIELEELTEQTVVIRESGSTTRAILDKALRRAGIRLPRTIEIGSREAVREAVAAGLGVSLIPDSERGEDHRFHFLDIRNAALSSTEYIACTEQVRDREPIRSFLDCCRELSSNH